MRKSKDVDQSVDQSVDQGVDRERQDRATLHDPNRRRVRPRMVWGGLALAVLGAVLAGVGLIVVPSSKTPGWWISGAGAAALVGGGALGWWGGIMHDTLHDAGSDLDEVPHGGSHSGRSPGATIVGDAATDKAARVTARTDRLEAAAEAPATPSAWRTGSLLVLAAGALLVVAKGLDYTPLSAATSSASLRDTGFAIVLSLAGLMLVFSRAASQAVAGVAVVTGVLMVLVGLFVAAPGTNHVIDVGIGIAAVLGGASSLRAARAGA